MAGHSRIHFGLESNGALSYVEGLRPCSPMNQFDGFFSARALDHPLEMSSHDPAGAGRVHDILRLGDDLHHLVAVRPRIFVAAKSVGHSYKLDLVKIRQTTSDVEEERTGISPERPGGRLETQSGNIITFAISC